MRMSSWANLGIVAVIAISQWLATGAAQVGINYGTLGNNLASPQDAINLIKNHGIPTVRLFDPNHQILDALRGTNIKVSVGVRNEDLPSLASSPTATDNWLTTHILPFKDVSFIYISLGNEVIPGPLSQHVLPAMQNMLNSVKQAGLGSQIQVTTVVSSMVLGTSYPPSQGAFSPDVAETMIGITKFVYANGAPLMVNVYPYFALVSDPAHITMDFALFKAPNPGFMDGVLPYYNLFDAQMDAFLAAMVNAVGGASDVKIVVSETGWPSAGNEPYTSIANAQAYNNNLKNHVLKQGTPRRPEVLLDVFIFALFNENQKPAGVEQNFGSFYPSMEPVYPLWP